MSQKYVRYSIPPEGVFLTAFSKSRGLIEALSVENWNSALNHLRGLHDLLLTAFSGKLDDVEIKLLASDPQIGKLAIEVQAWNPAKVETILRPESALRTILLDKTSGRIRIEKPLEGPIKVLVVDDSSTIRNLLKTIIDKSSDMRVVAMAEHPNQARDLIVEHRPDVMTLDIHMPEMDGVTLLRKLMPEFHIRTVMISSLSPDDGPMVFDAMAAGAIDYIQKPEFGKLEAVAPLMLDKIRAAARARQPVPLRKTTKLRRTHIPKRLVPLSEAVFAIGSSTGGPEALRVVLEGFGQEIPPTVIVQHIPPEFSAALADRLNQMFAFEIREAKDGDPLLQNQVLIAPGGTQMRVVNKGGQLVVRIEPASKEYTHNPSVDVLFNSLAECAGRRTVAAVLTGMGQDGALGSVNLKKVGGLIVAQDEESSVVYGMPRAAFEKGGTHDVAPLDQIAEVIRAWIRQDSTIVAVASGDGQTSR